MNTPVALASTYRRDHTPRRLAPPASGDAFSPAVAR